MNDARFLDDLRARCAAGESMDFLYFWGHQRPKQGVSATCFSQWYEAPFEVDGQRYPTAEHFMMAGKAALFGDYETLASILQAPSPGAAKQLGRAVRGYDDAVWVAKRFEIVVRANHAKFAQNDTLRYFLLGTRSQILVEASPVDAIWGIGLARDAEEARDPRQWRGLNLLGFALMRVREALRDA